MKPIHLLFLVFSCCHFTYGQSGSKYFAFKGNYSISLYGGGAEVIGKIGDEFFPVINPSVAYHLTDRFSLVSEAIFYTSGPGVNDESNTSEFTFDKAANYGLALRYYTKRNLKCGTATFQTGVYLFDTEDEQSLNWIFTPGWIYPLDKKEKLFIELAGDFQMNQILKRDAFLMGAKLGVSFQF